MLFSCLLVVVSAIVISATLFCLDGWVKNDQLNLNVIIKKLLFGTLKVSFKM